MAKLEITPRQSGPEAHALNLRLIVPPCSEEEIGSEGYY